MKTVLPVGFISVVALLHASTLAFAGLGGTFAPELASAARWGVAVVYLGSVAYLAAGRDTEWTSSVLVAPPLALAIGLVAGMVVLQFGWNGRAGSPLSTLTACALPAVAAAIIAPALGALLRRALVHGESSS